MAWLSRVNFIASDTLSFTDINNLGNDIRAWGDNVNGGGYTLSNVVVSASAGTMATLSGGSAASSTLTLRSTSGAGTTDSIIFRTGSQVERLRIVTTGEVGIGTTTPSSLLDVGTVAGSDNFITVTSSGLSRVRLGYQASSSPTNNVNHAQIFADGTGNINLASRTNNASGLVFYTNSGTAASERMRITSAGNVGIGTTTPSFLLSMGAATGNRIALFDLGGGSGYGFGIQSNLLQIFANSVADRVGIGYGNSTAFTETLSVDGANVKIGGLASRATTAGTNQLVIFNGTAPVGTLANGASFYATSGEMRVMDAAGNATLLSPHDQTTNEWIYDSAHTPTGKRLKINVEKLLRFVNEHFALDCVQELNEG